MSIVQGIVCGAAGASIGWLWGQTSEWIRVLAYLDARKDEAAEDVRLGIVVDEHHTSHPLAWASPLFRGKQDLS